MKTSDTQYNKHARTTKLWNEMEELDEQISKLTKKKEEVTDQWMKARHDEQSTCNHTVNEPGWLWDSCDKCGVSI